MTSLRELRVTISRGVVSLILRQTVVQVVSLVTSVLVIRKLSPFDYGVYGLVSYFLQFLLILSDAGIASALIQQDKEPDHELLNSMFFVAQSLYLGVSLLGIPGSFVFVYFYHSLAHYQGMIWVALFTFYLSAFRIIPAVQMERRLQYGKLSVIEAIEMVALQLSVVLFAYQGYGVWSFIYGALVSRVVGLILVYVTSPFIPRMHFRIGPARKALAFGFSMQGVAVISFLRDSMAPTIVTNFLGVATLGIMNFAYKVSSYPSYPLNVVNRMMFPILARLQDDTTQFTVGLNQIIKVYTSVLYGTSALLGAFLPQTISILYGTKWAGATNLIYCYIGSNLYLGFTWPVMDAIRAKGFGKLSITINSMQLVLRWVIGVPAIYFYHYAGLEIISLLSLVSAPVTIFIARKYGIRVWWWANFWRPFTCLFAVTLLGKLVLMGTHIESLSGLVLLYLLGGAAYVVFYLILDRKSFRFVYNNVSATLSGIRNAS